MRRELQGLVTMERDGHFPAYLIGIAKSPFMSRQTQ